MYLVDYWMTQTLHSLSDSCRAHPALHPHHQQHRENLHQHPPQPALPQHRPKQPQPQSGHLIQKERGVRSAQAVRTERQIYCVSTTKNISAKNTQKVSLVTCSAFLFFFSVYIKVLLLEKKTFLPFLHVNIYGSKIDP